MFLPSPRVLHRLTLITVVLKNKCGLAILSNLLPSPAERTRCRYLPTARRHIPKHTYISCNFLVALKHGTVPTTPFSPAKCRYSVYISTLSSQMPVQCLQLHSLQPNAGTVPTTTLSPTKCRYSAYNSTPAKRRYSAYIKPTPLLSTSSQPYNFTFDASHSVSAAINAVRHVINE